MKKLFTPFRVGLLVIASAGVLFGFLTFVKKGGLSKEDSVQVWALFHDASGLGKKSRVQIAGINVGEIDAITLEGNRAKVFLKIKRDVNLHTDAVLRKRSESLLGDYMLDLGAGTENAPLMQDGEQITNVIDQEGMQQIFESLQKITGDIQGVTGSLNKVLGGDKGAESIDQIVENLVKVSNEVERTVSTNSDRLDTILANFEGVSKDVRGITHANEQGVTEIVENVRVITRDVQGVLGTVKQIVGTGEDGDLKESVASLKQTLGKLDRSLQNLEEITTNLKDGKGAVGTLLTNERVGQKLTETVEDVADFASRLTQLKIDVGIKSEYLISQGSAKNTVGIKIIPKPDKYYLLELVDDPRGAVTTTYIQTNPPSTGDPATQVQRVTEDRLKFTAQFAKRFYFLTLRFGLTENTGGVGADANFFNDVLALKLDVFNFSVQELKYPRVRAMIQLRFLDHLVVTAGIDDALNNQARDAFTNRLVAGRDIFVGGGIFFTDDDLKAVVTAVPLPSP